MCLSKQVDGYPNEGQRAAQVAQLKASRDKLLVELEKQFLEVDRLSVENAALSQVAFSGDTPFTSFHSSTDDCEARTIPVTPGQARNGNLSGTLYGHHSIGVTACQQSPNGRRA